MKPLLPGASPTLTSRDFFSSFCAGKLKWLSRMSRWEHTAKWPILRKGPSMPIQIQIPASTFRDAVSGLVARPEEKTTLLARIPTDKSAVAIYLSEEDKPVSGARVALG